MDFESEQSFTSSYGRPVNPNNACFYYKAVVGMEDGKPKLIDKVYILILSPGQRNTEVRRPVQEKDKQEYPEAWRAFQEGKATPLNGTPIEMLPGLMPSRIAELKLNNIRTIEDMANTADGNLRNLGIDSLTLKQSAKAFVEKNTGEVQALRTEIADLRALVAKLSESAKVVNKESQPTLPKRRGRPRKTRENVVVTSNNSSGSV